MCLKLTKRIEQEKKKKKYLAFTHYRNNKIKYLYLALRTLLLFFFSGERCAH